MKVLFAKAISELQGETKKLLRGSSESCAEILENVHSNCRALKTGELMRESTPSQTKKIVTRRVTNYDM